MADPMRRFMQVVIGSWCFISSANSLGQTVVLDFQIFEPGEFVYALPSPNGTELVYLVDSSSGNNRLDAVAIADGSIRTLPTNGIEVGSFRLDSYQDRFLVADITREKAYGISLTGNAPPIALSPEPGQPVSGLLAPTDGLVALLANGDPASSLPAERDRVYVQSLFGGTATNVIGTDLPQYREVSGLDFSEDAQHLLIGAYDRRATSPPTLTSSLYLASSMHAGLTQVLANEPPDTRYLPVGSDTGSEYFLTDSFRSNLFGSPRTLFSIPIDNPTDALRLNVRPDNTSIAYDALEFDATANRVLLTSYEPEFNPLPGTSVSSLLEIPLDASSDPRIIANLPAHQRPSEIRLIPDSPWDYVLTAGSHGPQNGDGIYAINSLTSQVVEFTSPVGEGILRNEIQITEDGLTVVFTDNREAGNDLYLGRVTDTFPPSTLLDVAETERLVDLYLSSDEQFAIVGLVAGPTTFTAVADRFIAVPLAGGAPITLDDGTTGPVAAQFGANGTLGPWVMGNQFIYGKGFVDGQGGLYRVDLPSSVRPGDYNQDGLINSADYDVWSAAYGTTGADLREDGNYDGVVDAADYTIWRDAAHSTPNAAVPEPKTLFSAIFMASFVFVRSSRIRRSA